MSLVFGSITISPSCHGCHNLAVVPSLHQCLFHGHPPIIRSHVANVPQLGQWGREMEGFWNSFWRLFEAQSPRMGLWWAFQPSYLIRVNGKWRRRQI